MIEWDESKNDPLYGFTRAKLANGENFAVRVAPDGSALISISKQTLKSFLDRYAEAKSDCMWALSKEAVSAIIASEKQSRENQA